MALLLVLLDFYFLFYVCNYYYMTLIITERKWRNHVECVLRKDICMRRSKAVISTCAQSSGDVGTTATRSWKTRRPNVRQQDQTIRVPRKTPIHLKGGPEIYGILVWPRGRCATPVLQKCLPSTHFSPPQPEHRQKQKQQHLVDTTN